MTKEWIEKKEISEARATKWIPHGASAEGFMQMRKVIAKEGAPTINRATRRKAQRVGDAARRRKGKA